MSYIAKPHMQAGPTGDPGKAPACNLTTSSAATSRPSFLAPSLTSYTPPAAGPAADLGRHGADIGDVDVEQFGAIGAHHELPLARAPDRALAVIANRDD